MRPRIAVAVATSVAALGIGFAVPALADATSSPKAPAASTAPLTASQKQAVQDFLAQHPRLGQRLATRAQGWETFLAAHPELRPELAKLAALPKAQRRAEARTWFKAHPADRAALKAYRQGLRAQRSAGAKLGT
jgi:hemophore-related protein